MHTITRRWHREDSTCWVLQDAARKPLGSISWSAGQWRGMIFGRSEPRSPDRLGSDLARARQLFEGILAELGNTAAETQLVQLCAASPLRPLARTTDPVDGLALFDHARQPQLAL